MKKLGVALPAAVVLGSLLAGSAMASPVPGVLDQSNAPGAITISQSVEVAQTFTAGKSGLLTRVALWMDQADPGSHTLVQILTTSGGKPTNQQIGSSPTSYPANAANWVTFDLESPAPVSAGTQYAIMFETNFGGWTARAYGSGDTYHGGQAFELDSSTGWVTPATPGLLDFAFQTYVDPQTITLGWDKTQVGAGMTTPIALTETLVYPAYNPAQSEPSHTATPAVTFDSLPSWFSVAGVTCSSQIAAADCTVAGTAPGNSVPVVPNGDPITLTLTGTASPAAAGTATGKAESCVAYSNLAPLTVLGEVRPAAPGDLVVCVSAEASVVAGAATTTPPPTATAVPTADAGSGTIAWLAALFLGAVVGSAAYLRRRLAGVR